MSVVSDPLPPPLADDDDGESKLMQKLSKWGRAVFGWWRGWAQGSIPSAGLAQHRPLPPPRSGHLPKGVCQHGATGQYQQAAAGGQEADRGHGERVPFRGYVWMGSRRPPAVTRHDRPAAEHGASLKEDHAAVVTFFEELATHVEEDRSKWEVLRGEGMAPFHSVTSFVPYRPRPGRACACRLHLSTEDHHCG